ncbi:MAG: amidohydrolase family protein [Candidatus Solibacter usitatus]|nr:amidohydrolase family protein [Candidatus Solibacter usitatus]
MLLASLAAGQTYDVVIRGGRVVDPESRLDGVRHIGIRAGRVAAVSTEPLQGKSVIDAAGLVVAPGFIDLHAHGQDEENQRYQAMDGVTAALELEIGAADIEEWYRQREGRRLIHSGVSVGHVPNRMQVLRDPSRSLVPSGDGARRAATGEEITAIRRRVEKGLEQGALGVGFGVQYTPAASRWEILEMFRAAGKRRAPAFIHIRHMGDREPSSALNALQEALSAAAISGAPLHVVHITSSGLKQTPQLLQTLAEARARGLDVTTECYPYNAAMTELQSAMFDDGWQKVLGVDYGAIEWTATGERLTPESFARYRKTGGMVVMHMIPDAVVNAAVSSPLTLIASDGVLENGKGHPRGSGTFSRVLGHYVRDAGALTLMDALRKMSLMPAQRLEAFVPAMRNKGRIRVGADADLTLFDPARVSDRSTFQNPAQYSAGIQHVLVGGVAVVKDGQLQSGAWFQVNNEDRHAMDRSKPEEPRLARTLDGGETWRIEAPRSLLPSAQGGQPPADLAEPMDFTHPDFAMTLRLTGIHTGPSLLYYSTDRGKNWRGPFRFPLLGQQGIAARTDYLVNGPRDCLVFLTASKSNGREGRPLAARTTDGGLTWNLVSWIGPEPEGFAIMPSTLRLSPARLLTAVRRKEGALDWIDAYVSEDDARSWSYLNRPVASTGGAYSGNPPSLIRLRDGRLCLTYGYRGAPYGIRARLSPDEGKSWGQEIPLRVDGAAWDLGYTRSVQRTDGKVVTVYYIPREKEGERTVEATIWEP